VSLMSTFTYLPALTLCREWTYTSILTLRNSKSASAGE
jgi:hypothetical protein